MQSLPAGSDEESDILKDPRQEDENSKNNLNPEHSKKNSIRKKNPKPQKMSKLGISYPTMPIGVVKRIATLHASRVGAKKARLKKDSLKAIMQASDWFLEQVGDDLGTFAKHAGRKTINESDVMILMRRYVLVQRPDSL